MSNPFLDRVGGRSRTSHGNKSEKRLSKVQKAQLTPGSGAFRQKGDFRKGRWLHEAKATVQASLGVKKEWLDKLERQALMTGHLPALNLSFVRGNGSALPNGDWVAIRLSDFNDLIGEE